MLRLLKPWQLLHASPTPRTHGQFPTSHYRGIPININRPNFPLSLPTTLSLYPYEACHRFSSLPHMRLRLQPAVLGNVSQLLLQTDAPDPHLTHGRYFGVRSVVVPPTATTFQPHPSSKGKRKRSFADRQCSHQRHPEVLRQRFPRLFINSPKQQHSTKRRPTPENRRRTLRICQ